VVRGADVYDCDSRDVFLQECDLFLEYSKGKICGEHGNLSQMSNWPSLVVMDAGAIPLCVHA
jgi:hypothetical protein